MDYLKIDEVSKKWGISPRRIQKLCLDGKIDGAVRFGRAWMIPKDAQKPIDGRTKESRNEDAAENLPFPKNTPFLYMSDLYYKPGMAEECIDKLSDNHLAKVIFEAEIAYSRGEIDQVYARANYLLNNQFDFYGTLSAGVLLALCAIWHGDLSLWRRAKIHIAEAPCRTEQEREIVALSIASVDSMLYHAEDFPDWFKIGCFEPLHKDSFPAACVFYAKYLYAAGYAVATKQVTVEGVQGKYVLSILPYTIEPMICQAMAASSVIAEIYLRMTCAVIYHNSGNDAQAIRHLDHAIALALPDKLYGLLAEYCRNIGRLLENRLSLMDKDAWDAVNRLYNTYNNGWSSLSGAVRGRQIVTTLSRSQREVAKLAAFGMSNAQIAEKLGISLSVVKQAIRIVSEKTGASRSEFAAYL